MNRLIFFSLYFVLIGCDTSNNIDPTGDSYFIKYYGALGDQEGVSIQPTPDGGFIIGGNSIADFGGQSDYLLIKTDVKGNQEWMMTYDFNSSSENDNLQDVLVDGDSYVLAGTSKINTVEKIILLRVDLNGNEINRNIVQEANALDYRCTGITLSSSGNFVIVGSLNSTVGISEKGNSILSIHNNQFDEIRLTHSGDQGADITHVKGFEIINENTQEVQYLAVGFKETSSEFQIGFYLFNSLLDPENSQDYKNILDTKTVDVVPIENGNFMILGRSNDLSAFVKLFRNNDKFELAPSGARIQSEQPFLGKSLSHIGSSEFAVSGDIIDPVSTKTESSILKANSISGIKDWQRFFGTDFSYTSGKTITLSNGSVVYTGIAGLNDQTKVFLIKLKPNGEMK